MYYPELKRYLTKTVRNARLSTTLNKPELIELVRGQEDMVKRLVTSVRSRVMGGIIT